MLTMNQTENNGRRGTNLFNKEIFYLLGIVAVGAALRLYRLGAEDIWLDEAISINYHASGTFQSMFKSLVKFDCNPPLYFIILHYWLWLGRETFTIRLLSAIFGIISLPVFYYLAKVIFSTSTALIGTLLFSLSPYHLWYSQEVRMYSLQVLLILCSFYYFSLLIQSQNPKKVTWLLYILFTVAGLYTHYFTIFIIPVQGIVLCVLWKKEKQLVVKKWKGWLFSLFIIGLLNIPLLFLINMQHFLGNTSWIPPMTIRDILGTPFRLFLGAYIVLNRTAILCACLVFCTVIIYMVVRFEKIKQLFINFPSGMHLCFWWLFFPIIILILISLKKPVYVVNRYLIISLPAFFMLLGCLIDNLEISVRKEILVGFLILTLSISLGSYYSQQKKIPFHIPVTIIQEEKQEGDALIFLPAWEYPGFQHYYRGMAPGYQRITIPSYFHPEQVFQVWKNSKLHPDRIWYITVGGNNLEVANFLDSHYKEKQVRWQIRNPIFEDVDMVLYQGLVASP